MKAATMMPRFDFSLSAALMLSLTLLLMLCSLDFISAERDFNFNDSQVPLLEPKDEPTHIPEPYAGEVSRCNYDDTEIILSLVLQDHDWHDLSDNKKEKVLDKLEKFFAIPKLFIKMDFITKRELNEMQKESIRKGENILNSSRRLGRVGFTLGCADAYFTMAEPIIKQIGAQMKSGAIDNITGQKFGWWVVWRKHYKPRSQRKRRQVEGSGEDDYEEDYDYDDDEEDNVETVTEIPAVTTHAHRHHHGVSKSDLTDSKLDLTNNNGGGVAKTIESENESDSGGDNKSKSTDSNLLLLNKNGNIDEEIVESVSQLESVITKTIENTKNIKELPVAPLQEEDVPPVVAEIEKELESPNGGMLDEDEQINLNNVDEHFATSTFVAISPAELLPNRATTSSSTSSSSTKRLNELNSVDNDEALEAPAVVPLNRKLNADVVDMNSLAVAEVSFEPTTTSTVTVGLEMLSSSSTNTITTTTATPFSTLLTNNTITTSTTITPLSPQSPYAPYEPSASFSSSSSSSSLSSSYLSTTTTTTPSPLQSATTMQTKDGDDEEDGATVLPVDALLPNVNRSTLTTTTQQSNDLSSTTSTLSSAPPALPPTTYSTPTSASVADTTTPTSTAASTDYVEPKVENMPPMIKTRLQKFAVTSGKSFNFIVPEETFYDSEDITNLRLGLTDKDGHELKPTSWLQFDAERHEIYGLPLDDAVSKWQYSLTATDSGNETVTEKVEISVQQHRGVRSVNHEINIAVKINEKNIHNIDWQMKLMRAIASTLGDTSNNAIVVREVRQLPQDPNSATFVYFNETLPTVECPEMELNVLVQRLDAQRLTDLVYPTLSVKSITGQLIGACQKAPHIAKPNKPTTHMTKNLPPMPRNQVDRVNATVHHLLVFKVPSDTFYDPNDQELTLSLKTKDHKELGARHWLQFDTKNQEFYGIPRSGDVGIEEYLLVAEDSGGLSATDALVVVIGAAPRKEYSVYFKAYLAIRHEQFNADLQRKFIERIAQLFGDQSTQFIQIRSVTTHHDSDGTIVNFYNTTLYKTHNRCSDEDIEAARSVYLMQDSVVRDRVKKALGPELNLTSVQVIPLGSCHPTDITHREFPPIKSEEPSLKSTFTDDYLYTFILPAVVIVVLIVIASIIACCLHRRRRKSGKMELGDEEERKSFRTKGIPVIFQDELDEKPEIGNKSPIILKDEKPPLLPPSYNTSNMNGDNDVDEYVPPPAVVVGGREVRGKSPATPSYRKPPPYVSP